MKFYKMSRFYRKALALLLLAVLLLPLFFPVVVHADRAKGDAYFQVKLSYFYPVRDYFVKLTSSFSMEGDGHFNVRTIKVNNTQAGMYSIDVHIFSDAPFTCVNSYVRENIPRKGDTETLTGSQNFNADTVTKFGNTSCYYVHIVLGTVYPNDFSLSAPNVMNFVDEPDVEAIAATVDLTKDSYRDPDPDTDGTLSSSIPTPKIHVNKDYSFGFDNCTDDYYIQMQGRFWSVDDIELYKENMMWKYRYSSYVKGDLNDWYTVGSKTKADSGNLSFLENGQACFDEFLQQHPVGGRSFYGGTNAVGNYFSGYNNALDTIKMLLGQPTSGYNGVDVYVRYFTYTDAGELIYGKWCHYYDDLAKSGSSGSDWDDDDTLHNGQQSENGLTDNEKNENEKNDDPRKGDHDVSISTPDDDYTGNGVAFTGVIELLNSLRSQSSAFLSLFSEMFSFLPSWLVSLIYASVGVCCFLGIWHFIRG